MRQPTGFYPRSRIDIGTSGLVSQAGAAVLAETIRAVGLDRALRDELAPWRKPAAVHDPAKIVLDLALALALGGDCLADVALLREQPDLFGPVASDPTVSRIIDALATDADAVLTAIDTARARARAVAWEAAGPAAPDHDIGMAQPLVIDTDATLVTAHSEKEQAAPTFKRGFGFHPLWAFVDHGPVGTGSRFRCYCGPGTPGRTPRPITSRWCARRCGSSPGIGQGRGRVGRSSSVPTRPAARTSSWPG